MKKVLFHQIVIDRQNAIENDLILECLNSWDKLDPSKYIRKIWNNQDIENFISINYPEYIPILNNFENLGEFSDFLRYIIIYHYGGAYMDWDIQLNDFETFDKLIQDNPDGYLVEDRSLLNIDSEHFYLPEKSVFLLDLIENIIALNIAGEVPETLYYTGAHMIRQVYSKSIYQIKLIQHLEVFTHNWLGLKRSVNIPEPTLAPLTHYWVNAWKGKSNPVSEN